jgi:hypothetical protein
MAQMAQFQMIFGGAGATVVVALGVDRDHPALIAALVIQLAVSRSRVWRRQPGAALTADPKASPRRSRSPRRPTSVWDPRPDRSARRRAASRSTGARGQPGVRQPEHRQPASGRQIGGSLTHLPIDERVARLADGSAWSGA